MCVLVVVFFMALFLQQCSARSDCCTESDKVPAAAGLQLEAEFEMFETRPLVHQAVVGLFG